MAKIEPAQRTLVYSVTPSSGQVSFDIDLARDLSAVNRRLYRQGMQYYVANVSLARADTGISGLTLGTAGDTWVVHNAWKKGQAVWLEQQRDAEKAIGVSKGTWADFKVTLDDNDSTPLVPIAMDGGTIAADEWAYSELVFEDDGDEYSPTMHLLGTSTIASGVGLVQEYAISRNQILAGSPVVPTEASDSIYAAMMGASDEFSDILIDDVEQHNDHPPYDNAEYVGGDTVADAPQIQDFIVANFAAGRVMSTGFTAECGLIRGALGSTTADLQASDVAHIIAITVAPGPYKGVMAAPMGQ